MLVLCSRLCEYRIPLPCYPIASLAAFLAFLTAVVQTAVAIPCTSADSPDTSVSVCVQELPSYTDETHSIAFL